MKTKVSVLSLALLLVIASSCSNTDTEKRIAKLERRVEQLEKQALANGLSGAQKMITDVQRNVTQQGNTTTSSSTAQNQTANAKFKWESTLHNFGTIKVGEVVNHTFKFTNVGTEDLIISSTSASCGCTVPKHTKKPIPPGGTGEITVRYDSKGKPAGQQSPIITVVANTSPKQTRLNLRGVLEKG